MLPFNYSDKSFFILLKTHLANINNISQNLISSIEKQYNEEKSEKIKEITNKKFERILSSENIEMI
jgi:hypothetical protein